MSAPDSSPTNRSTSATCGSKRRVWPIASSAVRALRHRVTHGCWLNSSRKPQWTTSWSSTISTQSLRPVPFSSVSVFTGRNHQPDLPFVAVARTELDEAAHLQRFERRQSQAHPRRLLAFAVHSVVDDLEHEHVVVLAGADRHRRRIRMLLRVAQRLTEDRLSQRLQLGWHVEAARLDIHRRVGQGQTVNLLSERRGRGTRCATERLLDQVLQLAERLLDLGGGTLALLQREVAFGIERQRDAEQALHDAVVHLARHVDAVLQLASALALERRDACCRGKCGGLAERPEQMLFALVERLAAGAVAQCDADPASGGDKRHAH